MEFIQLILNKELKNHKQMKSEKKEIKRVSINLEFSGEKDLDKALESIKKKILEGQKNKMDSKADSYSYKYLLSTVNEQMKSEGDFIEIEPRIEEINGKLHYIYPSKVNDEL